MSVRAGGRRGVSGVQTCGGSLHEVRQGADAGIAPPRVREHFGRVEAAQQSGVVEGDRLVAADQHLEGPEQQRVGEHRGEGVHDPRRRRPLHVKAARLQARPHGAEELGAVEQAAVRALRQDGVGLYRHPTPRRRGPGRGGRRRAPSARVRRRAAPRPRRPVAPRRACGACPAPGRPAPPRAAPAFPATPARPRACRRCRRRSPSRAPAPGAAAGRARRAAGAPRERAPRPG